MIQSALNKIEAKLVSYTQWMMAKIVEAEKLKCDKKWYGKVPFSERLYDGDSFPRDDGMLRALLDQMAEAGICCSLVYGPTRQSDVLWSVNVLTKDQEEFEHPIAALNLCHAVAIARQQCLERGWL